MRRSLGVVLLINFLSVAPQLTRIDRIQPVSRLLGAARRDLGVWGAYARFPTALWWLPPRVVGYCGAFASALIVADISGNAAPPPWATFGACWMCWISCVNAYGSLFWFPWDKLTCEIALFGAFLPAAGCGPPVTQVRLVFRLLLFRVMFGMALAKFRKLDDRSRNLTYIYHFLEWQPFPTASARTLRDLLPMVMHKASFVVFAVIELVLPFVALCTQDLHLRRICFIGLVGLQAMIMWTGNFGCFNIATAALCWPLLVDPTAVAEVGTAAYLAPHQHIVSFIGWSFVGMHTLFSVPFLLHTTSWDHGIWLNRPSQLPWWMPGRVAEALRFLAPLRLWNSYGVFIHRGNVPHQVPVLQMLRKPGDDKWIDIEPHFLVCNPGEPPRRFAPHHPRIDHYLFYSNFKPEDMKLPCLDGTNPYYLSPYCLTEVLVTGLLRGDSDAWFFFRKDHQCQRPHAIRHTAWHYFMLTPAERRAREAKGLRPKFWRREVVGVGPAMTLAQRKPLAKRHNFGMRQTWDPFVFDTFSMDENDALCVAGERLNPCEVAVVVPKGKEPPRSRAVVDELAKVMG